MIHHARFHRKGVALIVVILIILAVTAIALVALHTTQNDLRQVNAFSYNRQAAQGAHSSGLFVVSRATDDTPQALTEAHSNAVADAVAGNFDNAFAEVSWYDTSDVSKFSGMDKIPPSDSTPDRLKGDLAKPTFLVATLGNLTLINKPVAGMSDQDLFCTYTMHANSYAVIGRAVPIRGSGNSQYYLLSDINSRSSGFKREMGLLELGPFVCNN